MKNQTIITAILFVLILFAACRKKDPPKPAEQELITTMKLLITDGAAFSQEFMYKVDNGFGSTTTGTVQIDTIKLVPNKIYYVTTELFNEKAMPIDSITTEVLDERNAHLFLYQSTPASGAGSIAFSNGSKDFNNLPFNQTITFTTGNTGSGTLQVNLIHAPADKNGATPATSGGETDAEAVFPVMIQ
jgi:hypothetical protein